MVFQAPIIYPGVAAASAGLLLLADADAEAAGFLRGPTQQRQVSVARNEAAKRVHIKNSIHNLGDW